MNSFGLIRVTKSSYIIFLNITCKAHCSIASVGKKAYIQAYMKGDINPFLSIVCLKIGLDSASLTTETWIIIFVKKVYLNEPVVTLYL